MTDEPYQKEEFLAELTELSRKYRIRIWGCGCCFSPELLDFEDLHRYVPDPEKLPRRVLKAVHWPADEALRDGRYVTRGIGNLNWQHPEDPEP